jgi:hypothetical protein
MNQNAFLVSGLTMLLCKDDLRRTPYVLVLHSIGRLHTELTTLAVQGFWLESQRVAKMELL